jgi:ribonuclease PH
MDNLSRHDGRSFSQIRPIKLQYDAFGYADASLLFELGQTKVLVSVSLQQSVPPFLKGQRTGWISAEYSMLPCATQQRTIRESNLAQRNARSVEISRLIGRCLRSCINMNMLGERSILIDCDVLQADGGTRVASITAASLALNLAVQRWMQAGLIEENIVNELVAAISVGVVDGKLITDLSYVEDKDADADFNFVISHSGSLIEIQGTSEKKPISWVQFEELKNLALKSVEEIFNICSQVVPPCKILNIYSKSYQTNGNRHQERHKENQDNSKSGIFSLSNRIKKS